VRLDPPSRALSIEPGRDDVDLHLADEIGIDDGAEDDVGIFVRCLLNDA